MRAVSHPHTPKPPLKGILESTPLPSRGVQATNREENAAAAAKQTAGENNSEKQRRGNLQTGIRFSLGRISRQNQGKRLVILRGFMRAEGGTMKSVQVRAMVDSGATCEFISAALVKRMGAIPIKGNFGVAVEAFGAETPLTQQLQRAELSFDGVNPRSSLATSFRAKWNFTVAPQLSGGYDLILGTHFLRNFNAGFTFHEPCEVTLKETN